MNMEVFREIKVPDSQVRKLDSPKLEFLKVFVTLVSQVVGSLLRVYTKMAAFNLNYPHKMQHLLLTGGNKLRNG